MLIQRKTGTTSEILHVFIQDSASTTGAGKTGLAHNTASLTAYYSRSDSTASTAISLVTMTKGTYTSGGFIEMDATNMPGWYQFCPPNAVFTSGRTAAIHLQGASGMAPCVIAIELDAVDNLDSVRGGMTALPNATAGATDGLVINGTNSNRIATPEFEASTVTLGSGGDVTIDASGITLVSPASITIGSATITEAVLADLITTATRGADTLPTTGTILTGGSGTNQIATSSGAVPVYSINANVITASALATDAVTEIQSGLSTLTQADIRTAVGLASADLDTQLGDISTNASSAATDAGIASTNTTTLTDRLTATRAGYLDNLPNIDTAATRFLTMIVLDGSVYQYTVNALENAPAGGGGGGGTINVLPLQITAQTIPTFTINGATVWNIDAAQNSTPSFLFVLRDSTGTAVSVSGKTLRFILHSSSRPNAPVGELATGGNGITVGGTDNNQITVTLTQALTARPYDGEYKLWNITDNALLGSGKLTIRPAPNDF